MQFFKSHMSALVSLNVSMSFYCSNLSVWSLWMAVRDITNSLCVTGSGQQSVTGVSPVEDSNSYWSIRGTSDSSCSRGTPVKCGQTIRLTHVNTGRNLHSHYFASPLSSNQVGVVSRINGDFRVMRRIIQRAPCRGRLKLFMCKRVSCNL